MFLYILGAASLVAAPAPVAALQAGVVAPATATATASPAAPPQQAVVGVWRMVAVNFAKGAGQATRGDGLGTDGLIIYTPGGNMTAHIVLPATAAGQGAGAQSHHAYFGTYRVDAAAKTITHHRFANTTPGLPIEVVRGYRFLDNGQLVLTPNGPGDQLIFERVGG